MTAGPTREKIDPIRFISNRSTGVMGYEIARAARKRAYKVTLISGPTGLTPPRGVDFISVESTRQMQRAVRSQFKKADCLFMASAVCDWRPSKIKQGKMKASGRTRALRLVRNPDILSEAGRRKNGKLLAGFALESADLVKNAKDKLRRKNLDIIAANKVGRRSPFGKGITDVLVLTRNGRIKRLKGVRKKAVADYLIDEAERLWQD